MKKTSMLISIIVFAAIGVALGALIGSIFQITSTTYYIGLCGIACMEVLLYLAGIGNTASSANSVESGISNVSSVHSHP